MPHTYGRASEDGPCRSHALEILPQALDEGLIPIGQGLRTAWYSV
jgi:hypothetical protein